MAAAFVALGFLAGAFFSAVVAAFLGALGFVAFFSVVAVESFLVEAFFVTFFVVEDFFSPAGFLAATLKEFFTFESLTFSTPRLRALSK